MRALAIVLGILQASALRLSDSDPAGECVTIERDFGELGNNIIQVANGLMVAAACNNKCLKVPFIPQLKSLFQYPDRIILNHDGKFANSTRCTELTNNMYAYAETNNIHNGTFFSFACFDAMHECRSLIQQYLTPYLKPEVRLISQNIISKVAVSPPQLTIHLRGVWRPPGDYGYLQAPCYIYDDIIKHGLDDSPFLHVLAIGGKKPGSKKTHPCISHLSETCKRLGCNFSWQQGSLAEDAVALMGATNLVAPVSSTFSWSLSMILDHQIDRIFYPFFDLQDQMLANEVQDQFTSCHAKFDRAFFHGLCSRTSKPLSSGAVLVPLKEPVLDRWEYMLSSAGQEAMTLVKCPAV